MRENEQLKLDLFDARLPELDVVMREFNYSTVMCMCSNCEYRERSMRPFATRLVVETQQCTFEPAWNYHLQRLNIAVFVLGWDEFLRNVDMFSCSKYANISKPYVLWTIRRCSDSIEGNTWSSCGWASPILDLGDPRLKAMQILVRWSRMTPEEQTLEAYDPRELDAFLPQSDVEIIVGV